MLGPISARMTWADRTFTTSEHAIFLREIAANAGYASLVSLVTAVGYVLVDVANGLVLRVASAIALALGVHLVLVLFMVMKRVFALTENRLNRARTKGLPPRAFTSRGARQSH
jgi:hypothetical protein